MYTKEMYVIRIKIIALSQIRNILDAVKQTPAGFRKDTVEYLEAMYYIVDNMTSERLAEIVNTVHDSYVEQGMDDDGYVADSLMMIALAEYQNELGERNIYDMGWDRMVEDFFRTAIA